MTLLLVPVISLTVDSLIEAQKIVKYFAIFDTIILHLRENVSLHKLVFYR